MNTLNFIFFDIKLKNNTVIKSKNRKLCDVIKELKQVFILTL